MDTNKMRDISREQFEKFAISAEGGLFSGHLAKGEDGEYLNYPVQCYWDFWQASRAAAVVELPAPGHPDGEHDAAWHHTRNGTIDACRRAIEVQGLRVTP